MSSTETPDDDPDTGGDDILAAEFVLGALPVAEQAELARRVDHDPTFARLVAQWDERLSPMADGFRPETLPPAVKRALDLRMFGHPPAARVGFWDRLAVWRGISGLAAAAFLLALIVPAMQPPTPTERLAASLTAQDSGVTYLVVYDAATGSASLAHMTGDPVAGRDFQLWVARGSEPPVSLGVIPAGVSTRVSVTDATRDLMTSAAHMAISLEPPGGSPTGQPTGPVLAVGDLLDI